MADTWDSIKLFGAVSDNGETFFFTCEENFNSDTTILLLDTLQTESGEKTCVVSDNASYFTANAAQEFDEGTSIELCYFPRSSPKLNPVEECWRRLNQALGDRQFDTLKEIQAAALTAPDNIKPPNVLTYTMFLSINPTCSMGEEVLLVSMRLWPYERRENNLHSTLTAHRKMCHLQPDRAP